MIIVNFKNYKTGKDVLKLDKKIEKYISKAIIAVPALNIKEVSEKTKLKVFAQHVDFQEKGKTTGFIIPESLKESGAIGSLLNHSEHKISFVNIKKTINRCKKLNFKIILCASNLNEVKKFKKLKPYAIAFEDPKLISTGKSITKYNTKGLKKFVSLLKKSKIIPICGAGISSVEDAKESKRLGCYGVLVASAIANVKNPDRFLKNLG